MYKTRFYIATMDCPSEERMIRIKLDGIAGIYALKFNTDDAIMEVYHEVGLDRTIQKHLKTLNMDFRQMESVHTDQVPAPEDSKKEHQVLWIVLAINFSFFLIELITGLISRSIGLVADSLDMLADSFVYAMALFAVGRTISLKKRVARISGYLQITLALIGFAEVVRRFMGPEIVPDFRTMMIVSGIALLANIYCLWLLKKTGSTGAHMQASVIFTSNDIAINLGVILAGTMVWYFGSSIPDLIIGSIVFFIVIRGAWQILGLAK